MTLKNDLLGDDLADFKAPCARNGSTGIVLTLEIDGLGAGRSPGALRINFRHVWQVLRRSWGLTWFLGHRFEIVYAARYRRHRESYSL